MLDRADLRGDRRSAAAPPTSRSAATSSRCCCRRGPRSGEELSDKELRDELLTLVLAGHETTANSLAWTWERLVRTPRRPRGAARRGPLRRGRRRADRGDDRRGDALAAGDPADRPAGQGAVAARRVRGGGRHAGGGQHPARPPPRGPLPASRSSSAPSAGSGASPAPTSGSPSAAASAAASARRWRWPSSASCWRRWPAASTSRPTDPAPERAVHRNVTMIPARGARVVIRSKHD